MSNTYEDNWDLIELYRQRAEDIDATWPSSSNEDKLNKIAALKSILKTVNELEQSIEQYMEENK